MSGLSDIGDDLCWCGEKIVEDEYCREHMPRCKSGAHFLGNCKCVGEFGLRLLRLQACARAYAKAVNARYVAEARGSANTPDHELRALDVARDAEEDAQLKLLALAGEFK